MGSGSVPRARGSSYGTAYRLELANRPPPNGGVEVELVVPFRPDVRRRVS